MPRSPYVEIVFREKNEKKVRYGITEKGKIVYGAWIVDLKQWDYANYEVRKIDRKKQLLMEYKHRKTEMGIISFLCVPTKESFIGHSQDTKAYINSNRFKLEANLHRNSELQKLWNQNGESSFEIGVLDVLPYDEKDKEKEDYTKELEAMCSRYLRNIERARRI